MVSINGAPPIETPLSRLLRVRFNSEKRLTLGSDAEHRVSKGGPAIMRKMDQLDPSYRN